MSTPDALRLAEMLDAEFVAGRISNHTGRWSATELRRQHAEIERLRADAARYRWLAQDGERIGERMRGMLETWDGCDGKAGFDLAIDAAMRDAP